MKRLRDAACRAYIALGNHDAANRTLLSLPWPEHVQFFDQKKPQRVLVPGGEVALYGQSFRERHISEDMTANFPMGDPGLFNIGVLHTSASGAPGHEAYAPCSLDSLRSRRYQYWALGHVHTRTQLASDPYVVFPGNIQGRSVRECGSRGCYLVDVDGRGGVSLSFEPLDVVRWAVVSVPVDRNVAPADLEALAQSAIGELPQRRKAGRWRCASGSRATGRLGIAPPRMFRGCATRLRMSAQEAAVPVHVEKVELAPAAEQPAEDAEGGPMAELRALIRSAGDESLMAELARRVRRPEDQGAGGRTAWGRSGRSAESGALAGSAGVDRAAARRRREMRLDALDLIAYGPFTGRRLEFGSPFTIVYGPNEAGKSSALRALLDALYGIHPQTPDAFLHSYANLRIGIELSSAAGRLRFVRRKGRVQTLRAPDDSTVVEDSALERTLHGVVRATFETMFGISHRTLVEGGRALAEGKGEVGELLFVSAAGLAGMQSTLVRLNAGAGELYAPRASSKSINHCLGELRQAEQDLKDKQVVTARFQENRKALDEIAGEFANWTAR